MMDAWQLIGYMKDACYTVHIGCESEAQGGLYECCVGVVPSSDAAMWVVESDWQPNVEVAICQCALRLLAHSEQARDSKGTTGSQSEKVPGGEK